MALLYNTFFLYSHSQSAETNKANKNCFICLTFDLNRFLNIKCKEGQKVPKLDLIKKS